MSDEYIRPIVEEVLARLVAVCQESLDNCTLAVLRHADTAQYYETVMIDRIVEILRTLRHPQLPDIRWQVEVPVRVNRNGLHTKRPGRLDLLVYITDKVALVLELKAASLTRLIVSRKQAEELLQTLQSSRPSDDHLIGTGTDYNVKIFFQRKTKSWEIVDLPTLLTQATTQASHYAKDLLQGAREDILDTRDILMYPQSRKLQAIFYAPLVFFGKRVVVGDLLVTSR